MKIVNVSAYRFVNLAPEETIAMRFDLKEKAVALGLKGTILLSTEGINLFLAAEREPLEHFKRHLESYPVFEGLWYKESLSEEQPFNRLLVRLKKEIISMGRQEVKPLKHTAPHLKPEEFKGWYEREKDMIVLDTRNDYEIRLGTFQQAMDLGLDHFRQFPEAIKKLPESFKKKPVVTFCTGGIRCEKAAELLLQEGFEEVYQLEGGIIHYFERCGGAYYEGECFVFDKRVALDAELRETQAVQCYKCREPLTEDQLQAGGGECPYCHQRGGLPDAHASAAPPL